MGVGGHHHAPFKNPGFRWMGGWLGPQNDLDVVKDKMSIEIRSPHRLSRNLFATLRNTDHEMILKGEGLPGVVGGGAADIS